jgi:hypothetical protein
MSGMLVLDGLVEQSYSRLGVVKGYLQPHSAADTPFEPSDIHVGQKAFDTGRFQAPLCQERLGHTAELANRD